MATNAATDRVVASRHRLLVVLTWVEVVLVTVLALAVGEPMERAGLTALVLVAMAVAAMLVRNRVVSSCLVALALVSSSIVLDSLLAGDPLAEAHFLFVIAAVSLYRDWRPLAVVVVLTAGYHLLTGLADDPYRTAAEIGFAVLVALVCAVGWRSPATERDDPAALDRLRLAFDEAPIGMAMLRPSGELIQANKEMGRLLGMEPGQLPTAGVRAIVHHDDLAELGEAWEAMGNDSGHTAVAWVRCMNATGNSIWCRMWLSMVPWAPGRPAMVVMQLEDVTAAHVEEGRLRRLLDARDEYVAAVGDEIRRPLAPLIDLVDGEDPELRGIGVRAREATSMLDDLVASARAGAGHTTVVALPIDAVTLCADVVSSVPGAARVTVVSDAGLLVWADPDLTRQALYGLVSNAVRYGGPKVTVTVASSGPDTVFAVSDDGSAFPLAEQERMFTADLRHGPPATRPATVGLGLSVGRHLARVMGGDITYQRSPDGENRFELRLPSESPDPVFDEPVDVDITV